MPGAELGLWICNPPEDWSVSRIQLLTSKILLVCQEICDIKRRQKPTSIGKTINYTIMDERQTNLNCTWDQGNNSSAKEGSDDKDGWDETYSFHSKECHHEPNNPYTPSHHAPSLPSLSPEPSESSLLLPGDRSPDPASRIMTSTPALLLYWAKKACITALSLSVHTRPSGPSARQKVLVETKKGSSESEEELGMREESLLETGERGGGPGVGGLHLELGGGTGMAIDKLGGAEEEWSPSGRGSPSPLQVQQRES